MMICNLKLPHYELCKNPQKPIGHRLAICFLFGAANHCTHYYKLPTITKTDFENLYRFVACISAGKEYFDCVREPMIAIQENIVRKRMEELLNRDNPKSKRWIDNTVRKQVAPLRKSMESFDKRMEAIIQQFDCSKDPKEQAMIDEMIDQITGFLKTLEIEIKD